MSSYRIKGLFTDFDKAFDAIAEIKDGYVPDISVDDVTLMSPIEHPEIEEVLGERPAHVPKFTLLGATFGIVFGFLFLASAQANFLVQPQGGKPVIPLPSNIVLTYEMLILFGVLFTLVSFLIGARLLTKKGNLYSEMVSLDQVGVLVEVQESSRDSVRELFKKYNVLEIREEVVR